MDCCKTQGNNNCCSLSCGCGEQNYYAEKKKIVIDFMYLDLSVCTRYQGTEGSLEEAIAGVAKVFGLIGFEVVVNKIHIDSEEKAIKYRFESSPTIRINGEDIQLETKGSLCESCGDLCGDEVDCRVNFLNPCTKKVNFLLWQRAIPKEIFRWGALFFIPCIEWLFIA